MARRLFPDNDAWPSEASQAANSIAVALMDVLELLEEDGPIDLKDFHYLISHVAGSFTSGLSVSRRLRGPAEPPDSIIRGYPRLQPKGKTKKWAVEGKIVKLLPEVTQNISDKNLHQV
tara:strand:+ start:91 stop:444 length:354 start_codon:yes stop_codon:yes gene_type:complete